MSIAVTAGMIKELRERTGVGMNKCKEALEEAGGDMELAISNLRKAGMASAVKKEGRATNEGMIGVFETDQAIALVEVNAETDFVVKNDRFQQFLNDIAEEAAKSQTSSLEALLSQKYSKDPSLTVEEYRGTVIQAIGENIQIKRVQLLKKVSDTTYGIYSHLGGKVVTLAEISGSPVEQPLAKDIAMHIAAASPEFLAPSDVPQSVIDHEKEIARVQIQGKPANIVEKILEGKINTFFDEKCLLRQKFIKDDSLSIEALVERRAKDAGRPLKLVSFIRWNVGQ